MPRAGSPLRIPSAMAGKVRCRDYGHVGRRRRVRGQQATDGPQSRDCAGMGTILVVRGHCRARLWLGIESWRDTFEFALLVLLVGLREAAANKRMKLTGAAILDSRGMKVLQAAPAPYPYRSPTKHMAERIAT